MSTYESRKILFLGQTPTHIKKEQILDYFLYTFEFVWTAPTYEQHRDNIRGHFKGLLDEVKAKHEQELTIGQEWWSLVLLSLKDLAGAENFSYSTKTIQFLLDKITTLSNEELEDYANSINNIFYDEMPDVLSLRPLEVEVLRSDASKNDKFLAYFLDRREAFQSVFETMLEREDIEMMYMNELAVNEEGINEQFTDFWNTYFEIFTGFSISMFDVASQAPQKDRAFREQVLKEVNLVFLIASVKNNSKIDELNEKLCELLRPLYLEDAE